MLYLKNEYLNWADFLHTNIGAIISGLSDNLASLFDF